MTGDKYSADLEAVDDDSLAYAKTVELSGDGKDAWIFDIGFVHCASTKLRRFLKPPNSAASSVHHQTPPAHACGLKFQESSPLFSIIYQIETGHCSTLFEGSPSIAQRTANYHRKKGTGFHMSGIASSRSLARKFSPIFSSEGRWVGIMTPKKQVNDDAGEANIQKEKAEPVAAFSRPPPLPPFLGPLVALSMLESWTKHDNNDD
ncbi:Uncharacterized protein Adt_13415 [Abeliophyllum distichum]|uniref:Uncharacterized protein n=1 Tax=Abeliophyllum distichum TaxID=126358 RepID=A0ABD1TWQ7_9LAMI